MTRRRNPLRFYLVGTLVAVAALTWYLAYPRGWHPALAWLTALNLLVVPLWGYDKLAARRSWGRVPEAALHTLAGLGAVPASFLSMRLFRHKTLKAVFRRLYWTLLVVQAVVVLLWYDPGLRPW